MEMRSGPKVSGRNRRVAADQGWPLRGVPLYSSSETDDRIDSEPCELAINNSSSFSLSFFFF